MTCSERVSQWTATVSRQLPHLSRPQARVLALWSLGMVLAHSCGLSQVSALLALLLGQQEETLRQRLREWYYPAEDKAGKTRRTLEVEACFAPLLRWVLAWWPEDHQELALALDATTLGQRFTVLCISVLVRGCAIPVAWKVLAYNQKGSWQPHWQALLAHLDGVIPAEWKVLVLADRGLYAPWLYRQIVAQGWHPFLRINLGAKACVQGSDRWEWISHWLPAVGEQWVQRVACFADRKTRLDCTLGVFAYPPETVYSFRGDMNGIACALGLKGASRTTNGGSGAGIIPRCSTPIVLPACGWPWPSVPCGWWG